MSLSREHKIPGSSFGVPRIEGRELDPGMGVAVGRRTVFRKGDDEDWGKVADRVAEGNMSLVYSVGRGEDEEERYLRNAIASGALLTSGRHLQHGDSLQYTKNAELFTNCATAIVSFAKFGLLLNGSGVGRSYDDDLIVVDWAKAPDVILYLSPEHQDHYSQDPIRFAAEFGIGVADILSFVKENKWIESLAEIPAGSTIVKVEDSREGWAKSLEIYESMAYEADNKRPLVFDFSDVRACGMPIAGMQDRPASGPVSIMRAYMNVRRDVVEPARSRGMPLWEQAMRLDHHFSVEVQVGGARRAARMSSKDWRDPDILKFIRIKNEGGLWTSNNSIMVDSGFWEGVRQGVEPAISIFKAATESAYQTGEPGFINGDKLEDNATGFARERSIDYDGGSFGSKKYKVDYAVNLLCELTARAAKTRYPNTVNPCGEISLHTTGGYCVIADNVPFHAMPGDGNEKVWDQRVEDSVRLSARFLIRVNGMDSFYHQETKRTNRIGVALTGIHEYAWMRFGLGFFDMLDEYGKAQEFWQKLRYFSEAAKDEANSYSEEIGANIPVTVTTLKPSGSVSKLFGVTEGAHLPARRQYIRWVQFRGSRVVETGEWALGSDPLLAEYEAKGYPLRELMTFPGMTAVGFPTEPIITRLGMGDKLVTASDATPEQQYQYLRLLEKYWLGGTQANQVSYTLKMFTDQHSLDDFQDIVLKNQPTIKCCAILPALPEHLLPYEYLPEEEVSVDEFNRIVSSIQAHEDGERIDLEHLKCASGVCPI